MASCRFAAGRRNDAVEANQAHHASLDRQQTFDEILGSWAPGPEVLFSTGSDFGDGQQASHWKDSLSLGIMDPTAAPGEILNVSLRDLRAFDLIGYEITGVPEASSFVLAIVALSLGSIRRLQRS